MSEKERLIEELENYEPYALHFPHLTVDGKLILDVLRFLRGKPELKFFVDSDGKITPLPIQPQWISVNEKLPDDASDVLAYYDCGDDSRVMFVNYYKRCWYDSVFNDLIDDLDQGCITHWMPLPEPPKEVKRDD